MSYDVMAVMRNGKTYWSVYNNDKHCWVGSAGGGRFDIPFAGAPAHKDEFIFLTKGEAEAFAAELQKEEDNKPLKINIGDKFKRFDSLVGCTVVQYDFGKFQLIDQFGNRVSDTQYVHTLESIGKFLKKNAWERVN